MIMDMIGAQKEYDAKADESLQDLKEVLLELKTPAQEPLDSQSSIDMYNNDVGKRFTK
jgi:hypothetical protein